jgi:hypothetical protein
MCPLTFNLGFRMGIKAVALELPFTVHLENTDLYRIIDFIYPPELQNSTNYKRYQK